MNKRKMFLILYIIFMLITFMGAGYVLYNKGQVNAGYAIIPMLFGIVFSLLYRNCKKEIKENNK